MQQSGDSEGKGELLPVMGKKERMGILPLAISSGSKRKPLQNLILIIYTLETYAYSKISVLDVTKT